MPSGLHRVIRLQVTLAASSHSYIEKGLPHLMQQSLFIIFFYKPYF